MIVFAYKYNIMFCLIIVLIILILMYALIQVIYSSNQYKLYAHPPMIPYQSILVHYTQS